MTAPYSPENPFAEKAYSADNPFASSYSAENPFAERKEERRPSWLETQARATLGGVARTGLGTLSRVASALDVVTPTRFRSGMGPRFAEMARSVEERLAPTDESRRREFESGVAGANLASEFAKFGGVGSMAARVPALAQRLGTRLAGSAAGATAGAVEDIGTAPQESLASLLGQGARAVGAEQIGERLESAAQMPGGRALVGAVAGIVPDAAVAGLSRVRRAPRSVEPIRPVETPAAMPERMTPLVEDVTDPDRYANIGRMTAEEPQVAEGLRETVRGAVETRELGERLPPRGKEILGRLREAETEEQLRARVADLFGESPSNIVAQTADGVRVGREGLLRGTEELLETQTAIDAIGDRLRSGLVVNAEELQRLEAQRDVLRQQARDLFASISTQKTETARDLAAMRLGAQLNDSPAAWAERMRELARRDLTADELAQIEQLARTRDMTGLTKLGRDIRTATPWEKAVTLFKASLLTSPKSHMANLTGNVLVSAARQMRDIPATLFDAAMSRKTGIQTKLFDPVARARAIQRGLRQGVTEAGQVMRGDVPLAQKYTEMREVNFDNALANLYTKGVFRSLDAADRVFKGVAFESTLDEQARVLARARGLTGDAAEQFVATIKAAPPTDMAADAMLAAELATFQQNSDLSRAALRTRSWVNQRVPGLGDLLFPFAKTPANIAGAIIDYSPLGVLRGDFRRAAAALKVGPDAQAQRLVAERLGEVSVGTAIMAYGYLKGMQDEATGFYPSDDRTRAQWETEGKSEGAIKVGDQWVQTIRLSPIGNLLAIGAELADIWKGDSNALALAVGAGTAPLSAVTDLPMVQGASNIIEALNPQSTAEQKEAAVLRLGSGVVSGAIPFSGMLRSIEQATDPVVRETKSDSRLGTIGRQVVAGTPFGRMLPERIDPLGQPIQRGGTAVERFVSPVARQTDLRTTDPLRAALSEANAVVGRLSRKPEETPAAFETRSRFTGELVTRALMAATSHPSYRAVDTMNVDRIRRGLADQGVDVEGRSDDELRNAYRTLMLERAISRARGLASRVQPRTASPLAGRFEQALDRQR